MNDWSPVVQVVLGVLALLMTGAGILVSALSVAIWKGMGTMQATTNQGMATLHATLSQTRTELQASITQVRHDMQSSVDKVQTELLAFQRHVHKEFVTRSENIRELSTLGAQIDEIKDGMRDLNDTLKEFLANRAPTEGT